MEEGGSYCCFFRMLLQRLGRGRTGPAEGGGLVSQKKFDTGLSRWMQVQRADLGVSHLASRKRSQRRDDAE